MKNCKLIRLNGVENHIHMLVELNPSIALSKFVQDIKRASSLWLSRSPNFPNFDGWCHEYCAFTKSESDKDMIINYIKNQEHHHLIMTFDDEIAGLVTDENLDWNPRYMM
jgi:REP element-mobilizing transposase RayT